MRQGHQEIDDWRGDGIEEMSFCPWVTLGIIHEEKSNLK